MTIRIAVWSGPRNVSTALMYAFAQRSDTEVLDEPLYAAYLAHGEGRDHPGRDRVMAAGITDADHVIHDVLLGPWGPDVMMMKHMAHHLRCLPPESKDWTFLSQFRNVLLTRRPEAMLASLAQKLDAPTVADTGLQEQVALGHALRTMGQTPVVVTAEQILADPLRTLTALCAQLAIPFDPAMLSWPAGEKPYDGVWAEYWYAGVHQSTGFAEPTAPRPLPDHLDDVLADCVQLHEELGRYAD